jgi:peptide chain release factor 1
LELIEHRPGILIFRAKGEQAVEAFKNESGGHRFQRPSPTDKRGRIHSSTITVAVMPELTDVDVQLNERDLRIQACRGSGAGGQHRNQTASAVQITHTPSGIMVRCEAERSQHQNKQTALTLLRLRLWTLQKERAQQDHASNRKGQVGSGQRGDKRRTIRVQDGSVTDHVTGKSWTWRDYEKGNW